MKFKMNNMNWEIKELSQKDIKDIVNKRKANEEENVNSIDTRYYGITYHDELVIYLDKDLHIDRKRKTLAHELAHCYISSFVTHQEKQYDEEMLADIISNSIDIINEIVEQYFKLNNKKK